jgi:hypothetical protein
MTDEATVTKGDQGGPEQPAGIPQELPVVPISDNVVFPFTVVPLSIRAPRAVAAAENAMGRERMLAMVALRAEFEGEVTADKLYDIGSSKRRTGASTSYCREGRGSRSRVCGRPPACSWRACGRTRRRRRATR